MAVTACAGLVGGRGRREREEEQMQSPVNEGEDQIGDEQR
jgi:hypothetical protein